VTFLSILIMGVFIGFAMQAPSEACLEVNAETGKLAKKTCSVPSIEFAWWQSWVTQNFTWAYIGTQDLWFLFIIVLYFSKYSAMKLGTPDQKPEFSNLAWFSMVFSCGVAVGLFTFGVAEPIWHYIPGTRWDHRNDNERAQWAMNITYFHWGVHGWVPYCVTGLILGFMAHRKGLPMTLKSTMYPLIGDRIYGPIGDLTDVLSIIATIFGVCTSLGLGVENIHIGFKYLNGGEHWFGTAYYSPTACPDGQECKFDAMADWDYSKDALKSTYDSWSEEYRKANPWGEGAAEQASAATVAELLKNNDSQLFIIWITTTFATISVISGLQVGIKNLSIICITIGMFLMGSVLAMDDTWYFVDVFIQSIGSYMQWLLKMGFHTGAFSQHSPPPDGKGEPGAWMDWWTIFYWGWWVAWGPFVGMFLALISKGRTIKEFIHGSMTIPILYNFAWFAVFGAAGIKMERTAELAGMTCDDTAVKNVCRQIRSDRYTGEPIMSCGNVRRLSCLGKDLMWYTVLDQYQDIGMFLCGISVVAILIYFVCSSDSASLVVDKLAANGDPEPPLTQRAFWAFLEGATATSLIYTARWYPEQSAGAAMKAIQAVSIVSGLFYTALMSLFCLAMWRAVRYEAGDISWNGPQFVSQIYDHGFTLYPGASFNGARFGRTLKAMVAPWIDAGEAKDKLAGGKTAWTMLYRVALAVCFYVWIILLFADVGPAADSITRGSEILGTKTEYSSRFGTFHKFQTFEEGKAPEPAVEGFLNEVEGTGPRVGANERTMTIAWFFLMAVVVMLTQLRYDTRMAYGIQGEMVSDFFSALLCPYNVAVQCAETTASSPKKVEDALPPAGSESNQKMLQEKQTV
jgi:choline-glycine betaine transporter